MTIDIMCTSLIGRMIRFRSWTFAIDDSNNECLVSVGCDLRVVAGP